MPVNAPELIDRHHRGKLWHIQPQAVMAAERAARSAYGRFGDALADHVMALAGTMTFFYLIAALIAAWSLAQSVLWHNHGFDPYPYGFLFFILGGIMQSLFVPAVLVNQNRAAKRDAIKDEADHRAQKHVGDVVEEAMAGINTILARRGGLSSIPQESREGNPAEGGASTP